MIGVYQSILKFVFWKSLLALKRKPYWLQIVIFFFLSIALNILIIPILWATHQIVQDEGLVRINASHFRALIIAPVLETFLYQHLIYKLSHAFSATRGKQVVYILFSSLLFGSVHPYSASYFIFAFTIGLVLSYTYFFYSNDLKTAFWSTAFIHFLRNLLATLIELYAV
jgi:uncharacterized protein